MDKSERGGEVPSGMNEVQQDLGEQRILQIGKVLRTDTEGYLVSESLMENIGAPWDEPAQELIEKFQSELGDNFHSLYIRGSLVRGTAVEGVSDIDGLVLVNGDPKDIDWSWRRQFATDLRDKYPFVMGVDFGQASVDSVLHGEQKVRAFLIKTLSACAAGEDISDQLQRVKPGRGALIARWNFEKIIQPDYFTEPNITLKHKTKWLGKQILRAGMELVMEDEQAYTRDLYPCYELFSKHYPEKEPAMRRALTQALFSAEDEADFAAMRDDIGPWLARQLDKKYPYLPKNSS
ncbi:MAG: hypothetical protein U0526_02220 [Candidatus Saccharibacteria bacterium]